MRIAPSRLRLRPSHINSSFWFFLSTHLLVSVSPSGCYLSFSVCLFCFYTWSWQPYNTHTNTHTHTYICTLLQPRGLLPKGLASYDTPDDAKPGISRVGQNRIYTPYMTVYLVISLLKILYMHRIYIWFWPTLEISSLTCWKTQQQLWSQLTFPHHLGQLRVLTGLHQHGPAAHPG